MPASAPESIADLRFERASADLVEVVARRGRHRDVTYAGRARNLHLPDLGRANWTDASVTLCTRPDRWWVIAPERPSAETAARISALLGTGAIVVDQSSGYAIFDLIGTEWRSVLAAGCRLDLDPDLFPPGHVAATLLAQIAVVLIPHPTGLFVIVPTTFAHHFETWLAHRLDAKRPASRAELGVSTS
jgi:heterotetrameric sarcosine oxidase gamma subunit